MWRDWCDFSQVILLFKTSNRLNTVPKSSNLVITVHFLLRLALNISACSKFCKCLVLAGSKWIRGTFGGFLDFVRCGMCKSTMGNGRDVGRSGENMEKTRRKFGEKLWWWLVPSRSFLFQNKLQSVGRCNKRSKENELWDSVVPT